MTKLLMGGLLCAAVVLVGSVTRSTPTFGLPVSLSEASTVHGACPGTLFFPWIQCGAPCWTGGYGLLSVPQTLGYGVFGNGTWISFPCACGGWGDTWVNTACGGG
jgi:hypothetical protein